MSFAAVLVDPDHAALEDGPQVFNRARVDCAAHMLTCRMLDGSVSSKFGPKFGLNIAFVRHQRGLAGNVANDNFSNLGLCCLMDMERAGAASTLNTAKNDALVCAT